MTGKLGVEHLLVHLSSSLYGIFHQLEINIFTSITYLRRQPFSLIRNSLIIRQPLQDILFTPRHILHNAVIIRMIFLLPCIPHEFRFADMGKTIMFLHDREQFSTNLFTKFPTKKIAQMSRNSFFIHFFYIPCHIQKQLRLIFYRLYVTHIQNPYLTHIMVIRLLHLLIEQIRAECT